MRHESGTTLSIEDLADPEINDAHGIDPLARPLRILWISEDHHVLVVQISMHQAYGVHVCQAVEQLRNPLKHSIRMVLAREKPVRGWQELGKLESIQIFSDYVEAVSLDNRCVVP